MLKNNCLRKKINNILLLVTTILFFPLTSFDTQNLLLNYLEQKSLCNYEKAVSIIDQWTSSTSDPAVIETNIFRINELIKYPEIIEPAINAYKTILNNKIIQNDFFLKARINSFLNILYLRKGNLRKAADIRSSMGFIDKFNIAEPVKNTDAGFNDPLLTAQELEKRIIGKGMWFEASADLTGRIDACDFFEDISGSSFFLKSEISIPVDGKYSLMLGKTGHTELWIDGNKVFSNKKKHGFSYDQYNIRLELSNGRHALFVKTGDSKHGIKFSLRLCTEHGNAVLSGNKIHAEKTDQGIYCRLIGTSYFNSLDNILNMHPLKEQPAFDAGYLYYASGLNSEEDGESIKLFSLVKDSKFLSAANYYMGIVAQDEWRKHYFFSKSIEALKKSIEAIKEIADLKLKYNLIYDVYPLIEKIIEINPRSEQALELKARAFVSLGWNQEALKNASDVRIKSYKYGIEPLVYIRNKKYKEALNAYRKLYEMDRFDKNILNNLLECYLRTGRYNEADGLLNLCAGLFPNDVSLRLKHVELIKNIYGAEKALPYLQCARKISPNNTKVLLNTGFAYHKLNRDDLAGQYLQKALARDPGNAWVKNYLDFLHPPLNPPEGDFKDNKSCTMSDISPDSKNEIRGGDAKDFLSLEKEIFKHNFTGNQLQLYDAIANLLFAFPADPRSVVYYSEIAKLAEICGYKKAQKTLRRLIDSVNGVENSQEKNFLLLSLKLELERLLYRFNRNEASKLSAEFFPLRRWSLLGPFSKYGAYDIHYAFMPEITVNLKSAEIKRKEIKIREPSGIVNLQKYIYPENGVAYAVTTVACSQPVKVRIYTACQYKLFINGKEAVKNLESEIYRTCRIVKVWGSPKITLMIKLYLKESSNDFKVFITDENNKTVNADTNPNDMIFSDFNFSEEMDYPYKHFTEAGSVKEHNGKNSADFKLAEYFRNLGSPEAVKYYKKAIADDPDNPIAAYHYAICLLELSSGDNESALFIEGMSIIDNFVKKYPDFIPARQIKVNKLIELKNFNKAYSEMQKILNIGRNYLPLKLDYACLLMHSGFEKDFEAEINSLQNEFSRSIKPMLIRARYYMRRNILKSVEIYKKILSREVCNEALIELISIYNEQGRYKDITALTEAYDHDGKFTKEKINAFIDAGNYSAAKKAAFKEVAHKNDPYYNARLGDIAYLEGYDPSMYWQKSLSINPSDFWLNELIEYINTGRIEDPFNAYRNKSTDLDVVSKDIKKTTNKSSNILNRNMAFILNEDGSSRIFCEDSVLVNDPEMAYGICHYIKSRSNITGEIQPASIRIIPNAKTQEITPNEDSKKSYNLKISYFINNSDIKLLGSAFYATPYIKIQDSGESVSRFSLTVIAPEKLKIRFSFNRNIDVKTYHSPGKTVYTAELNNTRGESGEDKNLPAFAFSTMNDMNDFSLWYAGQIRGAYNTEQYTQSSGSADRPDDLVKSVYDSVSGSIELENNFLFSPRKAKDTLFVKKGSAENKTILAASILAEYGIKSYIAFTGFDYIYDVYFISPHKFTNILLYVPLDIKTGLWMDFSNKQRAFGNVDTRLIGRDAVVIIKDGYEIKKVDAK